MVHVSRWITHFLDFYWNSEVWSSRIEAPMSPVLGRLADTWHHWIITCDATVEPNQFAMGDSVGELKDKQSAPPQESATFCGKGAGGVDVRTTLDYFVWSAILLNEEWR